MVLVLLYFLKYSYLLCRFGHEVLLFLLVCWVCTTNCVCVFFLTHVLDVACRVKTIAVHNWTWFRV